MSKESLQIADYMLCIVFYVSLGGGGIVPVCICGRIY